MPAAKKQPRGGRAGAKAGTKAGAPPKNLRAWSEQTGAQWIPGSTRKLPGIMPRAMPGPMPGSMPGPMPGAMPHVVEEDEYWA